MRVLFPIDGSVCAWKTLEWAVGFLDHRNYTILLLVVMVPAVGREQRELEEKVAGTLLQEARALFEKNGFTVEKTECISEYRTANPADPICKYAKRQDVDQIIIGSHGYRGMARALMGSVSMEVFRKSENPVMVLNNQLPHLEKTHAPDFLS